jgi:hypothetical protein
VPAKVLGDQLGQPVGGCGTQQDAERRGAFGHCGRLLSVSHLL